MTKASTGTEKFRKMIADSLTLWDGAMGTMLQARGLLPRGAVPEELCLSNPESLTEIHAAYVAAGSMAVTTNSFGANRVKLAEYGLEAQVAQINAAAVGAARKAAGPGRLVAGSIGPTGKFVAPLGPLDFREAVDIFSEQIRALAGAGADLLIAETMMDLRELKAVLVAAREVCALPVVTMMTFEGSGATLLGTTPEAFGVTASAMGADAVGMNCSLGPDAMFPLIERLYAVSSVPVIVQPNAGMPTLSGDTTVFPMGPDEFGDYAARFKAMGVSIVGGCCGTTPDHIRAAAREIGIVQGRVVPRTSRPIIPEPGLRVASRGRVTTVGGGAFIVVGERINPTGKKAFAEELRRGELSSVTREAREQAEKGADILDVNVGTPGVDEPALMRQAVFAANVAADLPVMIDASDVEALRTGLESADGLPVLNSVTGEKKKLAAVLPLAAKYGAALVCLPFDEHGIPDTAAGRLAITRRIVRAALKAGVKKEMLLVDGLTTTVSASADAARVTLDTVQAVREKLALPTMLGLSNVSFGLPNRALVNRAFLGLAMARGLSAAIINPHDAGMADAAVAARLLAGEPGSADRYVERFAGTGSGPETVLAVAVEDDPLRAVSSAVIRGDAKAVVAAVERLLSSGMPPLEISAKGLLPGMEEVGRRFERNIVFLPQVMASAEAMKSGFTLVKAAMGGSRAESKGRILLATVEGDVHDIGKNIVATLLENHGFDVIDLGKNVPSARIIAEAKRQRADVVGLSALMTTTMTEMKHVIARLTAEGIQTVTIIGGAVVTEEFASRIGATLYASDGMDAVRKLTAALAGAAGKRG
ncbi:MAG TPA: homocysteine S-methyltransferase family protein [Candidatus Deferrimicrobiaceae bacterium]